LQDDTAKESFAVRAARLRSRLRSDLDSAALVRADRNRHRRVKGLGVALEPFA
jgi:hypothetical protein